MSQNQLEQMLSAAASAFVAEVLSVIKTANLGDLSETVGAVTGRKPAAGKPGKAQKAGGRLQRRTSEQLNESLDSVVSLLKSKPGIRAEEIQSELGFDRRELPRVLLLGLSAKKLKKTGERRATKYFAGAGGGAKQATKKAPKKTSRPRSKKTKAKAKSASNGAAHPRASKKTTTETASTPSESTTSSTDEKVAVIRELPGNGGFEAVSANDERIVAGSRRRDVVRAAVKKGYARAPSD
jgi:hypothetical protein